MSVDLFFLLYTHAGFYYIEDVVAYGLALVEDVAVHGSDGVTVLLLVDVVEVLGLNHVAVVVDFVLDVIGTVDVAVFLVVHEDAVHLGETVVNKVHHALDVLDLISRELLIAGAVAVDDACYLVNAVADTLYFGYLTQHGSHLGEPSAAIRERVIKARAIQSLRFKNHPGVHCNAQMTTALLHKYAEPDAEGMEKLREAITKMNMSARAYDRILKVARTIADLEASVTVRQHHIMEAIGYRNLDRSNYFNL